MPVVTVAGANSQTKISLNYDSSSNVLLARQLAAAITAGVDNGTIVASSETPPPTVPAGKSGYFVKTQGGLTALPAGYTAVVVTATATNAVVFGSGSRGESVLSDSATNLTFTARGGSGSVAAGGGTDQISIPGSDNGNWSLNTGNGNDVIVALGGGNDTIDAGGGRNAIQLGSGKDLITSVGRDQIVGGSGSETVDATGAVSDLVRGGSSNLYFQGGNGGVTILGGTGSDTYKGSIAGDGKAVVRGGSAGDNYLFAGGGHTTLFGGGNGDQLFANGFARQELVAGPGNETLDGSLSFGQDTFTGGPGKNSIIGGSGDDTFVAGSGQATIDASFANNTFLFIKGSAGGSELVQDLISPSQLLISLSGYGAGEENHILKSQTPVGTGVSITLTDNTQVTFENIKDITKANFT